MTDNNNAEEAAVIRRCLDSLSKLTAITMIEISGGGTADTLTEIVEQMSEDEAKAMVIVAVATAASQLVGDDADPLAFLGVDPTLN